jgi:hypothetical protein
VEYRGEKYQWERVGDHLLRDPETGTLFVQSPLTGAVMQTGSHPWNSGGKPGRSGRPKDEVKGMFKAALRDPVTAQRFVNIIHNGEPEHALRAIKMAADFTEEKPKQEIERVDRIEVFITGPPMGPQLTAGEIPEADFEVLDGDGRKENGGPK